MFYLLLSLVVFCIFMSLRTLFLPYKMKGNFISLETFLSIGYVYVTVVVGFGIIYMLYAFSGRPLLIETAVSRNDNVFETCFYFSAMTLFSVGHGDVIPQGAGRIITVLEALIGYTLPAAFVARAVIDRDRS
jgi:potassium channel LctB